MPTCMQAHGQQTQAGVIYTPMKGGELLRRVARRRRLEDFFWRDLEQGELLDAVAQLTQMGEGALP